MFQDEWTKKDNIPKIGWPDKGQIEFQKYSTRYREGLDLVLNQVQCNINSGERVRFIIRYYIIISIATSYSFRLVSRCNQTKWRSVRYVSDRPQAQYIYETETGNTSLQRMNSSPADTWILCCKSEKNSSDLQQSIRDMLFNNSLIYFI